MKNENVKKLQTIVNNKVMKEFGIDDIIGKLGLTDKVPNIDVDNNVWINYVDKKSNLICELEFNKTTKKLTGEYSHSPKVVHKVDEQFDDYSDLLDNFVDYDVLVDLCHWICSDVVAQLQIPDDDEHLHYSSYLHILIFSYIDVYIKCVMFDDERVTNNIEQYFDDQLDYAD